MAAEGLNAAPLLLALLVSQATAQTALPRVPSAQVRPGSFALVADPYSGPPHGSQILLVRDPAGRLKAWYIPLREGLPRLPADERWNPGPACSAFAVDFGAGVIRCAVSHLPDEVLRRYRWTTGGQRLTDFVPDLIAVPGAEEGGSFVLHR